MTMAVGVRRSGPASAIAAAGGLTVAAVLTILVPVIGAVRATDDSAVWFAPGALWVSLLPALIVTLLIPRRPTAALAAAAGAGILGVARLLADLPVLTSPDSIARPDLFVETTDRSLPFHAAPGGYVLLTADVLLVASGAFAAWRLGALLSLPRDSDEVESRRNSVMMAVGFAGVLLLAISALAVPYQGGYLANRYVAVGVPLLALVGAVVLAVLAALGVLVAGSLPRRIALGLLGGAAAGAVVAPLTAAVVSLSAPVDVSMTVWLGIVGAVLLVSAGFLTRAELAETPATAPATAPATGSATGPATAPSAPHALTVIAACLGLASAALAVTAAFSPLVAGSAMDTVPVMASHIPSGTAWWIAAIPVALASAGALVRRLASAFRAALMVVWAAFIPPMTMALDALSDQVVATVRSLGLLHVGAGMWCAVGAVVLGLAAAIVAAVAASRARQADASEDIRPGEEEADLGGRLTRPIALILGVAALVMAFLPVCTAADGTAGATLLTGYTVQTWAVWTVLAVTIGALVAAARTRRPPVVVAVLVAAALAQAMRLVVCIDTAAATGVHYRAGTVGQLVLVLLILAGAVILAVQTGRATMRGPAPEAQVANESRRVHR